MPMKPEYNFGVKKKYDVTLYSGKFGNDFQGLTEIYNKPRTYDTRWGTPSLEYTEDEQQKVCGWIGLSENAYFTLIAELENVGSTPEICEKLIFTLFQNEAFMADLPKRHPHYRLAEVNPEAAHKLHLEMAQFQNDWYSRRLSKIDEYSFELWVENEKIDEAYRLTIFPSFENSKVIRIWRKNDSINLIYKVGNKEYDCKPELKHYDEKPLGLNRWEKIQAFLIQNFWATETWYSWYGYGVNDGTIYLFEGWQNGEYKFLDDHSPRDENALLSQAIRLFQSLVDTDST